MRKKIKIFLLRRQKRNDKKIFEQKLDSVLKISFSDSPLKYLNMKITVSKIESNVINLLIDNLFNNHFKNIVLIRAVRLVLLFYKYDNIYE